MSHRRYSGKVPKKDKVWLASAARLAQDKNLLSGALGGKSSGGKRPTSALGQVPNRFLLRRRLQQGAPYKCPLIRELLWDWFVDMRASVASTISPKFMLMKARELASRILQEQHKLGRFEPLPSLDRHWLLRFKRDKGIVFRRPNRRYKCSRQVLLRRLRSMWLNLIRVRRLAEIYLKSDLSEAIWGIDEKPLHFNESGSKAVRTLELVGAPSVRLKQNHAATRERASLMTSVTSDPLAASSPASMPLELLFKAQSEKRTRSLVVPADLRFSVSWSEKGSYRKDALLRYLQRTLPPWTEARAARNDYRILMMDVAASHVHPDVTDFCWSRGFAVVLHYGCTTGVAQVNDTDLHAALEALYVELEQVNFNEQQLFEPGSISRRPQDVLNDAAATWRGLDHSQGVQGHRRNALSVKLDGSEDHLISREALEFWNAADMPHERQKAIEQVNAKVALGLISSFADWFQLIEHDTDPGIMREEDEGAEFEGELAVGEKPYADEEDAGVDEADDAEVEASEEEVEVPAGKAGAASSLVVVPGDDPAVVQAALEAVQRLDRLKVLRQGAHDAHVPSVAFQLDKEIVQLERGLRGRKGMDKAANVVLRRTMEKVRSDECDRIRRARAEFFRARRLAAEEAAEKRAKAAEDKARADIAKKIKELPATWTIKDAQADGKLGQQCRCAILERLRLRSPPLPLAAAVRWLEVRDYYAFWVKAHGGIDGPGKFLDEVNGVLEKLREHYKGETKFNKDGQVGGDPLAFLNFFNHMAKRLPGPLSSRSVTM
jgi:hypothetical protein